MTAPRRPRSEVPTLSVTLEGGWRSDGEFTIRFQDADNRAIIGELAIPPASMLLLLRNASKDGQEPTTFTFWGIQHVGQVREVATFAIPVDGYGQDALRASLVASPALMRAAAEGWVWDEGWNGHHLKGQVYALSVTRWVDPERAGIMSPETRAMLQGKVVTVGGPRSEV